MIQLVYVVVSHIDTKLCMFNFDIRTPKVIHYSLTYV